jgi:hypothetical protein
VIQHRSDAIELAYGTADIHIIAINPDHTFKADAIPNPSHNQRCDIQPFFSQQGTADVRFKAMSRLVR